LSFAPDVPLPRARARKFIQSRSHNLKYLAITGLALIVEGHPQYAAQHQLAVLDCLEGTRAGLGSASLAAFLTSFSSSICED
jgi:hypothetical protein